jgi:hypothetical protein
LNPDGLPGPGLTRGVAFFLGRPTPRFSGDAGGGATGEAAAAAFLRGLPGPRLTPRLNGVAVAFLRGLPGPRFAPSLNGVAAAFLRGLPGPRFTLRLNAVAAAAAEEVEEATGRGFFRGRPRPGFASSTGTGNRAVFLRGRPGPRF